MNKLTVRPMQPEDVQGIVDYLGNVTQADAERMGLAVDRIPPAADLRRALTATCAIPEAEARTFYSIWCVDGRAVGHSSLKSIVHGDHGEMHLHMWTPPARGKGYGGMLFCLSALDFYERFDLKAIVCEPRAANPMPNRMLQKIGFALEKTYVGASSELSVTTELNRYVIDRDVAVRYLRSREAGA